MKSNKKPTAAEKSQARRERILRVIIAVFSILLILSLVLQLTQY